MSKRDYKLKIYSNQPNENPVDGFAALADEKQRLDKFCIKFTFRVKLNILIMGINVSKE